MKKLLLLTIFSAVIFILQAQVIPPPPVYNNSPYVFKMPDANEQRGKIKRGILLKKIVPLNSIDYAPFRNNIDNMPIAANELLTLSYIGNNKAGLDVYQSSLDNIFVVKPDSTFYSGMPTGSFKIVAPQLKVRP